MKLKAAELIGIKASCVKLPRTTSQSELLAKIKELNESRDVHGIIVQMPLDSAEEIDAHKVTDAVDPDKDVDGLSTINEGKVATGDLTTGFLPCTPHGCLKLIEKSGVKVRDVSFTQNIMFISLRSAVQMQWSWDEVRSWGLPWPSSSSGTTPQ